MPTSAFGTTLPFLLFVGAAVKYFPFFLRAFFIFWYHLLRSVSLNQHQNALASGNIIRIMWFSRRSAPSNVLWRIQFWA